MRCQLRLVGLAVLVAALATGAKGHAVDPIDVVLSDLASVNVPGLNPGTPAVTPGMVGQTIEELEALGANVHGPETHPPFGRHFTVKWGKRCVHVLVRGGSFIARWGGRVCGALAVVTLARDTVALGNEFRQIGNSIGSSEGYDRPVTAGGLVANGATCIPPCLHTPRHGN